MKMDSYKWQFIDNDSNSMAIFILVHYTTIEYIDTITELGVHKYKHKKGPLATKREVIDHQQTIQQDGDCYVEREH